MLHEENLAWGRPAARANGTGALVLAGSSGRIDHARVDMLAARGVTALGMRWFGGLGLPKQAAGVPLELISEGIDALLTECDRVVLLGLSYGAEAVMLSAVHDPRPTAVVAMAPTDVSWQGDSSTDDEPPAAKFTFAGRPIPFVPHDRTWQPPQGPPAFRDFYRQSRSSASRAVVTSAAIPIERYPGDVVLVAGGDDQVWPSADHALALARRRVEARTSVDLIIDDAAGHPIMLPGETAPEPRRPYAVGGDEGAPTRLGRRAWPSIARVLGLDGVG